MEAPLPEWYAELSYTYRGRGADGEGSGGPKREKAGIQPPEVTDTWDYYDIVSATLTRLPSSGRNW